MSDSRQIIHRGGDGDEPLCNGSTNRTFQEIVEARFTRRSMLGGSLTAFVGTLLATSALSAPARARGGSPLLGFRAIPVGTGDSIVVPEGYRAEILIPWGEPLDSGVPGFAATNNGADQARQIGSHHDGMHFFPIEGDAPDAGSSSDGLLVLNHEYVEPRFMHASARNREMGADDVPMLADGSRDADEVLKEINGHGVSVVRVRRGSDGRWAVVQDDPLNRRVTAGTTMRIAGPVRGSDLVKTKFSPAGHETRGTINNCAHGVTPWNTYLTCEENWAGYFSNLDQEDQKPSLPREHARYGVRTGTSRYAWELAFGGDDAHVRFDASRRGDAADQDYRNEPNTFGWVVEIDPFAPDSTPVKRTALGRFAHEGVVFAPVVEGEPVVAYSGDDAVFEYIYKFVSSQPFHAATASGDLLDDGTLYVARFDEDGTGRWLPLVHGEGALTDANGFASQADVLVNTRLAADALGATKMDRPEWGAVDPATGEVYFTLTNNTRRTEAQVDAPNPRAESQFGHIIRWAEDGPAAAQSFRWDIFVLAGGSDDSADLHGQPLGEDAIFGSPDGLWFDRDSRLWIQTDIGESGQNRGVNAQFGNNQMLAADPRTGEIRRFLTGPIGQEITGVVTTPDQRTMFINVQHPGATTPKEMWAKGRTLGNWPDGGDSLPRSATVVITREDGGIIGA